MSALVFDKSRIWPRKPWAYSPSSPRIRSACWSMRRAWRSSVRPAGVGCTPWRSRSSSLVPSTASMVRIRVLAAASARCTRSAPRVMLPASTTWRNRRRSTRSKLIGSLGSRNLAVIRDAGDRSRQDGDHPGRKPGAVPGFRECHHDQSPRLRHLIQIGQHFDLVVIGAENIALERVIVLRSGDPRIGVGGLVARRRDLAGLVEILEHRLAPAGIMGDTLGIDILDRLLIRPALGPIRPHRHERTLRNGAMALFPRRHIVQAQ